MVTRKFGVHVMRRIGEWHKCIIKKDSMDLNAIEPIDPPPYWKYVDFT
jgi:hypothetical protein